MQGATTFHEVLKRSPRSSAAECVDHAHGPLRRARAEGPALERAAAIFQALGDPERLRLLELLSEGEACVGELVDSTAAGFSTVSQRLRVLRSEGLVVQRRSGKHVFYALSDAHVTRLVHDALEHAAEPLPREKEEEP